MITRDEILKIAEQLDGTCGSLDNSLEEYGVELHQVPTELLELLDDQVMECTVCGWWSDSSGFNDDQVCEECQEGEK